MKRALIIISILVLGFGTFAQIIMLDTNHRIAFNTKFLQNTDIKKEFGVENLTQRNNNTNKFAISIFDSDTSLYKMTCSTITKDHYVIEFTLITQNKKNISIKFNDRFYFEEKDFEFYNMKVNGKASFYSVLNIDIYYSEKGAEIKRNKGNLFFSDYYVLN